MGGDLALGLGPGSAALFTGHGSLTLHRAHRWPSEGAG